MDIIHYWYSPSHATVEGSKTSESITHLEYNSSTFKSYRISFKGFIPFAKKRFSLPSSTVDRAQEHMYFLLYWLNKHVFPNKSKGVKLERIPLVRALHSFDDVASGPFILAQLYHLLHEMTKGEPSETNLNGPTWMVQLWLQWYFLEFRAANMEFLEEIATNPHLGRGFYHQPFYFRLPLLLQNLSDSGKFGVGCLYA